VVICAYTEDRWDQLCAAVDSVHAQTQPPERVVVVIDHNPALFEHAQRRFTGDLVVENQGVQGLSDARNTGISHAIGDVVAFIDDDAAGPQMA
jgi:glycosyltransferase involved in cell wall biosynthesis